MVRRGQSRHDLRPGHHGRRSEREARGRVARTPPDTRSTYERWRWWQREPKRLAPALRMPPSSREWGNVGSPVSEKGSYRQLVDRTNTLPTEAYFSTRLCAAKG